MKGQEYISCKAKIKKEFYVNSHVYILSVVTY